jgi:outer membrane murein-binding lipoprotein Lpp
MRHYRLLVITSVTSLVIACVAVGLIVWIATAQPHWFASSYAPAASVDQVESDIADVQSRLDDLETGSGDQASTSVEDLSSSLDDLETGSGDQASSSVDDLATTVSNLCDAMSGYGGALGDIYLSAC